MAFARIKVRDNLPKSWLVTSPSSVPLHLARADASCFTCAVAPEWSPPSVSSAYFNGRAELVLNYQSDYHPFSPPSTFPIVNMLNMSCSVGNDYCIAHANALCRTEPWNTFQKVNEIDVGKWRSELPSSSILWKILLPASWIWTSSRATVVSPKVLWWSILLQPIMILSYLGLPHPAMVSHLLAIIGSQMLDTANPPPR